MIEDMELIITKIITIWMMLTIFFIIIYISNHLNISDLSLFKFGPNNNLIILYIPIDNSYKYLFVISFCFLNSIIRSLNHNILQSWIINEIQDISKNNIKNKLFCYEISCVSSFYVWFDFFMYMHILMSQIDLLLIEIFADLLITIFITKYYLDKKFSYTLFG